MKRLLYLHCVLFMIAFTACRKKDKPLVPSLTVDKTTVNLMAGGGTADIVVDANIDWALSGLPSWLTADKTGGTSGQTKVRFTVAANPDPQARTADITIASSSAVLSPQKVTVIQGINYQITSFAPTSATPGNTVILTGIFSTNPIVKFNGIQATVTSSSSTQILCTIPDNATTGKIGVTCDGAINLTSANDFSVIPFGITDFTPKAASVGESVKVTGNFGSNPVVSINNVPATITSSDATQVTFTVPNNCSGGFLKITANSKTFTSTLPLIIYNAWSQISEAPVNPPLSVKQGTAFGANGKIYLGLGMYAIGNYFDNYNNAFYVYDINQKSWSMQSLPTGMSPRQLAACFTMNGLVYVGGGLYGFSGLSSTTYYHDCWEFNPGLSTWRRLNDNNGLGDILIAFSVGGTGYLGLGNSSNIYSLTVNNSSDNGTWQTSYNTNLVARDGGISFNIGNKGYFGGGYKFFGNDGPLTDFYEYDPANPSQPVKSLQSLPSNAYSGNYFRVPTFTFNGKGYYFNEGSEDLFEYDPVLNKWSSRVMQFQSGIYYVCVINNSIYGIGQDGTVYTVVIK